MSKLSNEQILSNIYYVLERGYGSAKSLYEQAKEEGAVITLEEVKSFMKKQPNKQIKGYQNYNSYLVPYARAEFQIDIMDMNKFKKEEEERYGLIVVDANSRYAYIHPMENKNSEDVLRALKEAFKVMGEPIQIFSDEDTAFLSVLKKLFTWIRDSAKNNKNPCQYCWRDWCGLWRMELRTEFVLQKGTGQTYANQRWKNITIQYIHQLELNR